MKKKIKEKSDIEEAIKQKSSSEEHFKSFSLEWDRIRTTTFASFSAYYCYITIHTANCFSNFEHPLVVTDAVGNGESYLDFIYMGWHMVKILKSVEKF